MNKTHTARTRRATAATLICACALAPACSNPFVTYDGDRGYTVPVERLRAIDAVDLADVATVIDDSKPEPTLDPPPDPFAGMESLPVSLEQCRAWALSNNLDLKVALIDPLIQQEALSAEEAAFESTFFVNSRYSSTDQPTGTQLEGNQVQVFSITPGVTIPLRSGGEITLQVPTDNVRTDNVFATLNPSQEIDASFSISQPILRNAGRRANTHRIRIQALQTQITEAQAKLDTIRILADVDRAYWQLYAARELLEVREEQYRLAMAQLERARRRVKAQVDAEIEIIRSEEGVAQRIEGIIDAQNLIENFQRQLKRIVNVDGLEMGTPIVLELTSEPDPIYYEFDRQQVIREALASRMELLQDELRILQDLSTVEFEKNQALPLFLVDYTYNINGLGGQTSEALDVLGNADFADWSIGGRIEIPLGNNAAESRVNQAILQRLQRIATKRAREQAIIQEVYDALDGIEFSWQRILAARQTSILAGRTLEAEQSQFNAGLRTSTDVLDAATRLADAQQAEIRALVDYQIDQVDLAFATGMVLGASRIIWEPNDPRTDDERYGEPGYDDYTPIGD